jgi:ABC-type dipeptide/oligopeptide/nickel transport system permease component
MFAIPIGFIAAIKRNSVFDYAATLGATLGIALPSFWIGLMAIIIFSLHLRWLPATGVGSWKALIMPVAVLATQEMALLMRLTRGSALEVLRQDFVTTARAKGLAERVVIVRHVVRNALLPIVTVLGVRMAFILSGTIIVETIFSRPGLGQLFFLSVDRLDYQVVQAIVLLSSILVVTMNIVTDMVYAYIDPRIRIR